MSTFPPLPDQVERDRFCAELETNFSVIAPAGVGKTTSIVARIVAIATADARRLEDPILPRLVVVTYTKKAADEMFSRVRSELDRKLPHPEVHAHLAQAFFGTIHSFCQKLLVFAGPLCRFPSESEIVEDKDRLWDQFCRELSSKEFPVLPADLSKAFAVHGRWEDVFEIARQWPGSTHRLPLPSPPPKLKDDLVQSIEAKGAGKKNILLGQEIFRKWLSAISSQMQSSSPLPCPEPDFIKGGRKFQDAWRESLRPLRHWRSTVTRYLAAEIARAYESYRRRLGQFTFDDLIGFARELLRHEETQSLLRQRKWRVILDEAQDTDPNQFIILTEIVRPPEAKGCWIEGSEHGPLPGAFSMVGDPQQSIYSERADLGRYLEVHRRLLENGGTESTFSVTMRCPVSVVENLNTLFPQVLRKESTASCQVEYVRLDNPEGARAGQLVRWAMAGPSEIEAKTPLREAAYVQEFANWLKSLSPEALGTSSWGDVAILCPRNLWLDALGEALILAGLPIRQSSRSSKRAEDLTYTWFTALLTIFVQPRNNFELYGVLRDVFGFSDASIVDYIEQHYFYDEVHPLRIDRKPADETADVGIALSELHKLYAVVNSLSLYEAVIRITQTCQLVERLVQVPGTREALIEATLEQLFHQAAGVEAQQMRLCDWVEELQRALSASIDEIESNEDAITLITAHKSKGLGFDVVILPFFFRKFDVRTERYPCFEIGSEAAPRILFSSADRDESSKELQLQRRQELQERLLYVALTRVKRSLILFDDREWWQDLTRQRGTSWADILGIVELEGKNTALWKALPDHLAPPIDLEEKKRPQLSEEIVPIEVDPKRERTYWQRITPSSLQLHEVPSERIEPDLNADERFPEEVRELYSKDPAAYGNWWHDMMEFAPWEMGEDVLRIHFSNTIESCPDPNRGAIELNRFLENELFATLSESEWEVRTEVSFLLGDASSKTGYEGFIDLLAVNRETNSWKVVDWKTDRMPDKDPMKALKHTYAPQLEVYDAALRQSLGENGESCLYSTVTGEIVALFESNA